MTIAVISCLVSAKAPGQETLSSQDREQLTTEIQGYLDAEASAREKFTFDPRFDELLASHEGAVREVAWDCYCKSKIHDGLKSDFENKQVTFESHTSPFTVKTVGRRPQNGWPLFIALHGGGGAPQELNDSQWRHMQIYYRDQESVTGYKYLALRVPNNTWNGFYDNYVYPLIENLIRQFLVFGDVDPDKVFVMGYSHGGYGAFAIGPKIPFRFAAIHASASAPTGGETSARTLRNTRFTFMVGEKDTRYGRRDRCEQFDREISQLKEKFPNEYPVDFEYKEGFGHGGLPDRDKIKDMYPFVRNPVPRNLSWEMTDSVVHEFFWLSVAEPGKQKTIEASCQDNRVTVQSENVKSLTVWLDQRMIKFDQGLTVEHNGNLTRHVLKPDLANLCDSLLARGDIRLAFAARIDLESPAEKSSLKEIK